MHPVLIDFFGLFKLHTYGLMIALAFLVGMQLAVREAQRVDLSESRDFPQFVLDLCFWILIVAMVGSRVLFIIVNWSREYSRDPLKIFRIWEGGLVFYGGLIASILFSVWYSKKRGRDFFQVADMLIPMVALGHFFGRLGCFAAGCCWGKTVSSDFPLAVQFPAGSLIHNSMQRAEQIGVGDAYTLHVHPVQLYESFGELAIFFLLLATRGTKRFHGQVFLVYLFAYSILRTCTEFLRGDIERGQYDVFGLMMSTGQLVSVGVAIGAITLLIVLRKRFSPPAEPAAAT